jgi:hypothetical protein
MNVDDTQIIVDKAMISADCGSEAELARKMGMLPQNFNQKKKRGTIIKDIKRYLEKSIPAEPTAIPDAGEWKDKYIACMEKLIAAKEEIAQLKGEVTPLKTESDTG